MVENEWFIWWWKNCQLGKLHVEHVKCKHAGKREFLAPFVCFGNDAWITTRKHQIGFILSCSRFPDWGEALSFAYLNVFGNWWPGSSLVPRAIGIDRISFGSRDVLNHENWELNTYKWPKQIFYLVIFAPCRQTCWSVPSYDMGVNISSNLQRTRWSPRTRMLTLMILTQMSKHSLRNTGSRCNRKCPKATIKCGV